MVSALFGSHLKISAEWLGEVFVTSESLHGMEFFFKDTLVARALHLRNLI